MNSNIGISDYALAVVTKDVNLKFGGGCPIFYVKDDKEMEKKAMLLSKFLGGTVHDLTGGILIVVKH
ncbi:MAG: hypothetical protein LBN09_04660 [Clostridioides sp.]|jgi:hypothetical protein|nr:hypothetical protein [Clostridioides sp.]